MGKIAGLNDKVEMGLLMYEPLPINCWGLPYI
jgi:hypothetical protein